MNLVLDKEAGLLSQLSSVSLDKVRKEERYGTNRCRNKREADCSSLVAVVIRHCVAVPPTMSARRQGEQRYLVMST